MAKAPLIDHEDLPVRSAKTFFIDRTSSERRSLSGYRDRFVMQTDDFIEFFNNSYSLKGKDQLTRRTLLFYGSPQLRLLPRPVYRNRHTGYYIFPDHYRRLAIIWTLRQKFFFPLELIKVLLRGIPEESYDLIEGWWGSGEDLLDMIPLLKAGFTEQDVDNYRACKGLLRADAAHPEPEQLARESKFKARILEQLAEDYQGVKDWISSGRGVRFLQALSKARKAHPQLQERLAKLKKAGAGAGG
ncbi:MAG: hypothetical protein HY921_04040 [Elusimicrobia bacterium]|nr:hypothetical protein [Elusimicrobiota bacterium]